MAGIYLHIPFCRKACVYCDFHFITSLQRKADMVEAILQETALRQDFFPARRPVSSLYFGGGTPSVLSESELGSLLEALHSCFAVAEGAEITLEANPDDLKPAKLRELRKLGINRLSIGIQSFHERDLLWMNRSHDAAQARDCVRTAQDAGFTNLTLDLIFGLPTLTMSDWEANLAQVLALEVPHLSVYALTVEPRTVLAHALQRGKAVIPDDSIYAKQFMMAHDMLTEAGFAHYELSNYAREGFEARHNRAYWEQQPYLGLGPSAHSYDGEVRSWNVANNSTYLKALSTGETAIADTERLTRRDRYHEYVMTGLRKAEGIDMPWIGETYGFSFRERFAECIAHWQQAGALILEAGRLRLSPEGWLMSDRIIADFFLDEAEFGAAGDTLSP